MPKWEPGILGESRWIKNHLKTVWHQKARAEADVALAASALNAKSRVYESTKEQGDLLAMSSAAKNLHAQSENLGRQFSKIQHLKDG